MNNDGSNAVTRLLQQCLGESINSMSLLLLAEHELLADGSLLTASPADLSPEAHLQVLAMTDVVADLSILSDRRWPLVCILLPEIEKPALIELLARIRDLHADRVIHIDSGENWSLTDSLALGFSFKDSPSVQTVDGDKVLQIFEFDLHNYKPAPEWLNSRHWANPALWGKHRW